MTVLKKEDKVQLIESRFRQLEYRKYGLQLDLVVENAKTAPDANSVQVIENAITEINTQIAALNSELTVVNSLSE